MRKILISPSFLSANFLNLAADIKMINDSQADWFHLDVMDGVFVPNISFGFPIISHIKKMAQKPLDVHIMIVNPDNYIQEFAKVGADILTVHYEACPHLHRTVQKIKSEAMKAGVSLNPHTSVSLLENVIEDLDLVLIMSVNPGFGGQSFIPYTYKKVAELRKMIDQTGSHALIQVDGGVNTENSKLLFNAGADVLVAGSSVFKSENPAQAIIDLKKI
ncbi:MAG: ribulose-phosphate 3-epimerase [Bacteroidales bacterium]|nr:ribulose-phosphate 3-epimerase [Bacteroidales bacterium]